MCSKGDGLRLLLPAPSAWDQTLTTPAVFELGFTKLPFPSRELLQLKRGGCWELLPGVWKLMKTRQGNEHGGQL